MDEKMRPVEKTSFRIDPSMKSGQTASPYEFFLDLLRSCMSGLIAMVITALLVLLVFATLVILLMSSPADRIQLLPPVITSMCSLLGTIIGYMLSRRIKLQSEQVNY